MTTFTIEHRHTGAVLFECFAPPGWPMSVQDQDRYVIRRAIAAKTDLSAAELAGFCLTGVDLSGLDLSGANLCQATLCGANLSGATLPPDVPIIPDIDKAILAAIEAGGTLEMGDWHKCDTTHCRAGWAVHLAGNPGYGLERQFGTSAAGALIYAASRPDMPVPDFYASNEAAMADLIACAGQ